MTKINVNELSIKELKDLSFELFPDLTSKEINSTAIGVLQTMILEELENFTSIDPLVEREENFDISSYSKHLPSRKKKANRIKKKNKPIKYKKVKKEKEEVFGKHTRKKVDSETTNRSYMNKASKSFIPNRKFYSL